MNKKLKIFLKIFLLSLTVYILIATKVEILAKPIVNTAERIIATIEAITLKPLPLIHGGGNCRIVNTIEAMKYKDLYIVLGEMEFQDVKDYHLWTTKNANKPADINLIIDKAIDNSFTQNKQVYIPVLVLKLSPDTCNVNLIKQVKETDDRILYEKAFNYIEQFCFTRKLVS